MSQLLFYEKPGCINNTRQKAILTELGHELTARNLLTEEWQAEELRAFFGDLPVARWFNVTAPRIKSGELNPAALDEEQALALMLEDPILIRRPLIRVGEQRMVGFDPHPLLRSLGVQLPDDEDLQSCPRTHSGSVCAPPDPKS